MQKNHPPVYTGRMVFCMDKTSFLGYDVGSKAAEKMTVWGHGKPQRRRLFNDSERDP